MTNPLNEAGITATFAAIFDRLDRLEAIAAAQDTPSSPANAPEVPQGQTGDSDGTERIRVSKENPQLYYFGGEPLTHDELADAIRVWRKVQALMPCGYGFLAWLKDGEA